MLKSSLIATIATLMGAEGRVSFGSCSEVKQMASFDKYQYVGKWYE